MPHPGASISIRIFIQTLEAVVEASPVASLIIEANGTVVCANPAARKLLKLNGQSYNLSELFGDSTKLSKALAYARRSSGNIPLATRASNSDEDLRINIKALPGSHGKSPDMLLVTALTRQHGNQSMRDLKLRLQESTVEKRRLLDANKRLREKVEHTLPRLKKLSTTDALTGVCNRRYFDTRIKREWSRSMRQGSRLALLYVDIDHFKAYNDALGHPQGDTCLKQVAEALLDAVTREFDRVCRIGGEEFALLLPMTSVRGAEQVGKRVLEAVRALAIPHPGAARGIVTVSVGVGTCKPDLASDMEAFIEKVDAALYRAKHSGRDCLEVVPDMLPQPRGAARSTDQPGAA